MTAASSQPVFAESGNHRSMLYLEAHPDEAVWYVTKVEPDNTERSCGAFPGLNFDEDQFARMPGRTPGKYKRYLRWSGNRRANVAGGTEVFGVDASMCQAAGGVGGPFPFPTPPAPMPVPAAPVSAPPSPAPSGGMSMDGLFQLLIAQQNSQAAQQTQMFTAMVQLMGTKAQSTPISELLAAVVQLDKLRGRGGASAGGDSAADDSAGWGDALGQFLNPIGAAIGQELAKASTRPAAASAPQQGTKPPAIAATVQTAATPNHAAAAAEAQQREAALIDQLAPLFSGDKPAAFRTVRRTLALIDIAMSAEAFDPDEYAGPLVDALGPIAPMASRVPAGTLTATLCETYPFLAAKREQIGQLEAAALALLADAALPGSPDDPDEDIDENEDNGTPPLAGAGQAAPPPPEPPLVSIGPGGIGHAGSVEIPAPTPRTANPSMADEGPESAGDSAPRRNGTRPCTRKTAAK